MKTPNDLYETEVKLHERYHLICGIDEAGRGPLAGPVVAAAVILPANVKIKGLNDSKKLNEKSRERLFPLIVETAMFWGVGLCTEKEIDEHNILNATMMAMQRAVAAMGMVPQYCLVDGNRLPLLPCEGEAIIGGDSRCAAIAAASIVAKVTRDHMMCELDKIYPQYGFARHKGYPTKTHYQSIDLLGILPCHRRTFLKGRA